MAQFTELQIDERRVGGSDSQRNLLTIKKSIARRLAI